MSRYHDDISACRKGGPLEVHGWGPGMGSGGHPHNGPGQQQEHGRGSDYDFIGGSEGGRDAIGLRYDFSGAATDGAGANRRRNDVVLPLACSRDLYSGCGDYDQWLVHVGDGRQPAGVHLQPSHYQMRRSGGMLAPVGHIGVLSGYGSCCELSEGRDGRSISGAGGSRGGLTAPYGPPRAEAPRQPHDCSMSVYHQLP